ncbi:Aste57867_12643 [Aphanomyces stellatus]|uniref:Aste57867_12643 protein n=1 Tax=Aphanomyces stellatus TaxID=120398 RepID=A0A485KWR3_9STRA|nr:hypothetical protein As57867_012597 [Aphanomyces stellatus]VFT89493.1 Aste57867_12643 [Aphanomyces stellatus]
MSTERFEIQFDAAVAARVPDAFSILRAEADAQLASGRFAAAASAVEASLGRLLDAYGSLAPPVQGLCEDFILWCNAGAMQSLGAGQSSDALDLLTLADQHTTPGTCHLGDDAHRKRLRGITLNNFACYFKKHGKLHTAIQYLEKTLKIESSISNVENPAGTHLNICAILSQMGRHTRAAEHARCAIELLKFERVQAEATKASSSNNDKSDNSVLAIAYYNWGVELEHMRRFDQAIKAFRRGHEVACSELDSNHPMIHAIYKAMIELEDHVAIKKGYATTPRSLSTPRTAR